MSWSVVTAPSDAAPPDPLTIRAQSIPARHGFPDHAHDWHQLVYAVDGVLTVSTINQTFVISPEQAAWVPTGVTHRVGSLLGAQFRSLWISHQHDFGLPESPAVISVTPLMKALIVEAAGLEPTSDPDGYRARVVALILDQLRRAPRLEAALPWPRSPVLLRICEVLFQDPSDKRDVETWGGELGLSSRTLTRRFESEVGMPLRSWRRRLKVFRAIELLTGGASVTSVALDLGYSSASAFIFAFREEMGSSPHAFAHNKALDSRWS
ncbi:MAG: AraC family transcriptional regulator [Stutzerimonas stutzeri]|nr:MAG: AraC family transcriptional regulator [Stutzerimonas stutzeri]